MALCFASSLGGGMKAEEFDRAFDEGERDIVDDLDLSTARRANQKQKGINADLPSCGASAPDCDEAGGTHQ